MNMKKLFSKIGYIIYVSLVSIVLLEFSLRLLLYAPYHYHPFYIHSEPKQCILPDTLLGFQLNEGTYLVNINQELQFTASHDSLNNRLTPKINKYNKTIELHGCSYTYGFGIDDSLSYAYQLQQKLENTKVLNKAVLGYGNVQSYLLLEQAINQGKKPDIAVINYASFHDDRNVLTPNYRKDLKNGFANADPIMRSRYQELRYPYIVSQNNQVEIKWENWNSIYQNWPKRESSALINVLQTISDRFTSSHFEKEKLTNQLFLKFKTLCKTNNIRLIIAGITPNKRTKELINFCKLNQIEAIDISVDLFDVAFNNLPYDTHPNEKAHQIFAKKLANYLNKPTDY